MFGNVQKGFGRSLRGWNNAYRKGCIEGKDMLRRESMHNYVHAQSIPMHINRLVKIEPKLS
jgi:hypothetical protein